VIPSMTKQEMVSNDASLATVDLHVVVLSWPGHEQNALHVEKELSEVVRRVTVIHSLTGESSFSLPAHWVVMSDTSFYGAKFSQSLELHDEGVMLQIQADATCLDWPALAVRCREIFDAEGEKLGLWSPHVDWTSWNYARTHIRPWNSKGLAPVIKVDGIVWAIAPKVLERLAQFDYTGNNLGWGIDSAAAAIATTRGLAILLDSTQDVVHPRGSAYAAAEAGRQAGDFLAQLSPEESEENERIALWGKEKIRLEKSALGYRLNKTIKRIADPLYRSIRSLLPGAHR